MPLRPITPFAAQFGNGCQTQVICAAIERLGLYVGLRLDGTATDTESGRELALGGTFSLGLDLIRRVAIDASFPVGLIYRGTESTLFPVGPLRVGGRLRLGGAAPTMFSARPQPRLAWVLGAYVTLPLPNAAGDERHTVALGVPQPEIYAGAEIRWGPVQFVPSIGALVAERAVYLQAGGRVSLSISQSLRFDLEAQSRIPLFLPDDAQSRCSGGARVGLGLRGLLGKGVMGSAHYDHGSGDCEAAHRVVIGLTFAFGEEPLRHIPTPEEAGVQRFWLGMVDPVLDCNGWMLEDDTLLPKFKFGDPDPQDPNLIRRGSEVFHVGEHFDIDRYGRVYRPHQYVALAGEHEFTEAKTAEKLALPVCEFGPKHRFFERCQFLAHSVERLAEELKTLDEGHGAIAGQVREMQYEEECLASDEREDPRLMFIGMLSGLRSRARTTVRPPPPPPIRRPPGDLAKQPKPPYVSQTAQGNTAHAGGGSVQVTGTGAGGGGHAAGGSAKPSNGHLAGQEHGNAPSTTAQHFAPITTPYGPALQGTSVEALAARQAVQSGATLWRIGTTGRSAAAEGQFWALEHPLSTGYAQRYGVPPANIANANFIEAATLKPGTPFVTRAAPPVGPNPGGGIEVVVPEGSVTMRSFVSQ